MTTQLRMFTIQEGQMDAFVAAWRAGVYPLRTKYGFITEGAWVVPETNQFVWILHYEGPEGIEAGNKAYHASAERAALNPDPAQYIVKSEVRVIMPVV